MPDLLIELFSEEIPARMQARATDDLKRLITNGLVEAGLTYSSAAGFATPRRLCLSIEGLLAASKPTREERKGPGTNAPDKALEGFLRSTGLSKDALEIRDTGKGQAYFAVIEHPGRPAAEIIAEVLEGTIRNFPWPKSMRWGSGGLRWVRPLHSIICLLSDESGAEVVPFEIEGIVAGNTTRGHRFMSKGDISVSGFEDYEAKLKKAHVVLRSEERAETIWNEATNQAFARGLEIVEDAGLLAEVSGLVEWPVVLLGSIDDAFLALPPEVLQTSMKEHQKFFSVRNPKTSRIEGFVTVANMETADDGATILSGNQKVLSARLSDAKFFWENDLRIAKDGMTEWTEGLSNVTFHAKLGSQADRVERIAALAREIATETGAKQDKTEEAARIAKADLRSEMVGEFPELQGVMGRYYALEAGRSTEVANAARDHWKPMGQADDVPSEPVSVAVSLADKLDTLAGFWAIDEKPTGSKDPFALRRAALGVIRLVLENGLRLKLDRFIDAQLLRFSIHGTDDDVSQGLLVEMLDEIADHGVFGAAMRTVIDRFDGDAPEEVARAGKNIPDKSDNLRAFFHDRLKVFLRDEGIRHDVIDACLVMPGNDDLLLLVNRARALQAVLTTDDGENLLQGFKRANNILSQAEAKDGVEYSYGADIKFAEHKSEKLLFEALDAAQAQIDPALAAEDFAQAMTAMAELRGPIDAFFEDVQVNSENEIVRRNRLNLLSRIRGICLSIADLEKIEG